MKKKVNDIGELLSEIRSEIIEWWSEHGRSVQTFINILYLIENHFYKMGKEVITEELDPSISKKIKEVKIFFTHALNVLVVHDDEGLEKEEKYQIFRAVDVLGDSYGITAVANLMREEDYWGD